MTIIQARLETALQAAQERASNSALLTPTMASASPLRTGLAGLPTPPESREASPKVMKKPLSRLGRPTSSGSAREPRNKDSDATLKERVGRASNGRSSKHSSKKVSHQHERKSSETSMSEVSMGGESISAYSLRQKANGKKTSKRHSVSKKGQSGSEGSGNDSESSLTLHPPKTNR